MNKIDLSILEGVSLYDFPNYSVEIVLAWLKTQPDFMGEAIAKACYQQL